MNETKRKDPFLEIWPQKNTEFVENNSWENNQLNQPKKPYRVWGQVKKWKKISFKWFLIWCVIFLFFFIFIVFISLYYVLTSPQTLKSIWIEAETIKNLLKIFVFLFFWPLFFVWFAILWMNVFRLITNKVNRLKSWIWTFLGFIMVVFSIWFGIFSIMKINAIDVWWLPQTNKILVKYWDIKGSSLWADNPNIDIIAPALINFELNKEVFQKDYLERTVYDNLLDIQVICDENQTIKHDLKTLLTKEKSSLDWYCLFMEKWVHNIKVRYSYIDSKSWKIIEEERDLDPLNIKTQIDITSLWVDYKVSNWQIVVSNVPSTLSFDPNKAYTDLGIDENKIKWDFDWDGKDDGSFNSKKDFTYNEAKLYYVYFNLPNYKWNENIWFNFLLRVNESWLPACNVEISSIDSKKSVAEVDFWSEPNFISSVKEYNYEVVDVDDNKKITTSKWSSTKFSFTKPNKRFKVVVIYTTKDWKKQTCESKEIDNNPFGYNIQYDIEIAKWSERVFSPVETDTGDVVKVDVIPSTLRFKVNKVLPTSDWVKINMYINDEQASLVEKDVFELVVKDEATKEVKFVIEDEKGKKSEKIIKLDVSEKFLRAKLKVSKSTGETPFEVQFDASISELHDLKDEIIYFNWDFGDGQTMFKVTDWKVKHTYSFDKEKNNWTFYPKVTVETKKWLKDTAELKEPITVKKQSKDFKIIVESHPTQVVTIWDTVTFSISTDGEVSEILWDFGNWKNTSCEWRQCWEVNTTYEAAWTFKIKATVKYADYPEVVRTTNIKVR